MARAGTLEPDSFINPSLPLYVEWPLLWIQSRVAGEGGRAADPLLVGRVLSALAGAGAVFVIGLAGGLVRRDLGALAASALGVAPGIVNLCHFATPEPWLLLATAVTLLFALEHLRGERGIVALGVALGLAAATKYTAAALLVPVLVAVLLRPRAEAEPAARSHASVMALAGVLLLAMGIALATGPGRALAGSLHLKDVRLLRPEHAAGFVESAALLLMGAGAFLVVVGVAARRG
ncbi:MAG TPA: glycosyltransferase family 39 protein, partial [Vicinamibacteria bacterium]|nr:glycosyltransferase family 39 protein [Vicinamibacteria bacterium]